MMESATNPLVASMTTHAARTAGGEEMEGFVCELLLPPKANSQLGMTIASSIEWTFDKFDNVISKVVTMNPPKYDLHELARSFLDYIFPEWFFRVGDNVTEVQGRVGDILVAHEYHWSVQTSLCETLDDEMKLGKTRVLPSDEDIDPQTPWKYGYSDKKSVPIHKKENLKTGLRRMLAADGLLKYENPVKTCGSTVHTEYDGYQCQQCLYERCIWELNKERIIDDNNALLSAEASNKERRFFGYKQMTFALHGHLGKGQRRELPCCVVDGIREMWPEEDRKYTGYRDAKKRRKS
jgi:hypothetical protein